MMEHRTQPGFVQELLGGAEHLLECLRRRLARVAPCRCRFQRTDQIPLLLPSSAIAHRLRYVSIVKYVQACAGICSSAKVATLRPVKELGGIVGEFIDTWWHVALTILGGLGIAWVPLQLQKTPAPTEQEAFWLWVLLVVSCVVAGTSAFVEKLLTKKRDAKFVKDAETAYATARADFLVTITETIPPNLELLAAALQIRLTGTGSPPELINGVLQHCRAFLSNGGGHVRANYYRMSGRGKYAKLTKADKTGGNSRHEFTQTSKDTEGCAVVQGIQAGQTMFCPNVKDPTQIAKFKLDPDKQREYLAFLSVPVATSDRTYGMLSVNALSMGVLDAEDEKMLRLMAWLIITAEILIQGPGSPEPTPELVQH